MTSPRPTRREQIVRRDGVPAAASASPAIESVPASTRHESRRRKAHSSGEERAVTGASGGRFVPWGFWGRASVIALTLLGAVAHGYYSNRWHRSDEVRERAGRILEEFPADFGDWTLESNVPFEDNVQGILLFSGAFNRRYVHRTTGEIVSVAAIVGPPGQTSTHTAALCYGSRGYDPSSPVELMELEVAGGHHEIARTRLRPDSPGLRPLEVCYAWRQADRWQVPEVPRVAFGGGDYLFKFQVAASTPEDGSQKDESICIEFVRQLLVAMESHVFDRFHESGS